MFFFQLRMEREEPLKKIYKEKKLALEIKHITCAHNRCSLARVRPLLTFFRATQRDPIYLTNLIG